MLLLYKVRTEKWLNGSRIIALSALDVATLLQGMRARIPKIIQHK
jgi:hypothetical protein